jgi:PIN domain nuclease of toxin-antitoxin system
MRFLLDTHFLYWTAIDDARLKPATRELLLDPQNQFCFSAVSLWEIVLKRARRGPQFGYDPRPLRRQLIANGYEEMAIDGSHVIAVESLPPIHKDPFDRLLIAQATVEGIVLLTADATIARYPGPIRKV